MRRSGALNPDPAVQASLATVARRPRGPRALRSWPRLQRRGTTAGPDQSMLDGAGHRFADDQKAGLRRGSSGRMMSVLYRSRTPWCPLWPTIRRGRAQSLPDRGAVRFLQVARTIQRLARQRHGPEALQGGKKGRNHCGTMRPEVEQTGDDLVTRLEAVMRLLQVNRQSIQGPRVAPSRPACEPLAGTHTPPPNPSPGSVGEGKIQEMRRPVQIAFC